MENLVEKINKKYGVADTDEESTRRAQLLFVRGIKYKKIPFGIGKCFLEGSKYTKNELADKIMKMNLALSTEEATNLAEEALSTKFAKINDSYYSFERAVDAKGSETYRLVPNGDYEWLSGPDREGRVFDYAD